MPTKNELLAHKKNNEEMCDHVPKVSNFCLQGLYKALTGTSRNSNYPQFSDHHLYENIQ